MTDPRLPAAKILPLTDLLSRRASARRDGLRVVHCHGCFDIVHPGHIRHLRHARSMGDVLLVTITGDAKVGKGVGRPLIPQELRAESLAELDCVDWVSIDQHPTAAELLEAVRPDVYVKGKEYETNNDPRFAAERQTVERHGGRVVFSSGDVVFSSTALIASIDDSVDAFQRSMAPLLGNEALTTAKLEALIAGFKGLRVVVVGETIVDEYLFCDRPGVATESPVLTLSPVEERRYQGGAAIVARHLAAMGARPVLVTAMPSTALANDTRAAIEAEGVEVRAVRTTGELPRKQRMLVGTQKVVRLDRAQRTVLDAAAQDRLVELIVSTVEEVDGACDAAIITDFGLGMLSSSVLARAQRRVRSGARVLAGDVSGRHHHLREFRGFDLLCPSEDETRLSEGMHDEGLAAATWSLLERTRTKSAIVTMGPEGLVAFERTPDEANSEHADDPHRSRVRGEHVPAMMPYAVDPLGCGDALLSVATLTLAAGGSLLQAAFLGSVAAGAHSQHLGNDPVSASDLRRALMRVLSATLVYQDAGLSEPKANSGRADRSRAAS